MAFYGGLQAELEVVPKDRPAGELLSRSRNFDDGTTALRIICTALRTTQNGWLHVAQPKDTSAKSLVHEPPFI